MARKINYDDWSKDEVIKELRRIKETKYGLVWHRDLPEEKTAGNKRTGNFRRTGGKLRR